MKRNPAVLAVVLIALVGIIVLLSRPPTPSGSNRAEKALYPDLDTGRVDQIRIHTESRDVELYKDHDGWKVATEDSFPADPDGVDRLLKGLAQLSAKDVVSRQPGKYERFEVDTVKSVEVQAEAGGVALAHFYVGKSGPDFSSTYLRDAGRPEVFLQPEAMKQVFDRRTGTWKDKTIFRIEPEEMERLEVIRGDERLLFERQEKDDWNVLEPAGYQPFGALVVAMARVLTRLTATDFPAEEEREEAHLDSPEAVVNVELVGGGRHTLIIGKEREDSPARFVKRGSDEVLYAVLSSRLHNFLRPTEELIEPIPPDTTESEPGEED